MLIKTNDTMSRCGRVTETWPCLKSGKVSSGKWHFTCDLKVLEWNFLGSVCTNRIDEVKKEPEWQRQGMKAVNQEHLYSRTMGSLWRSVTGVQGPHPPGHCKIVSLMLRLFLFNLIPTAIIATIVKCHVFSTIYVTWIISLSPTQTL